MWLAARWPAGRLKGGTGPTKWGAGSRQRGWAPTLRLWSCRQLTVAGGLGIVFRLSLWGQQGAHALSTTAWNRNSEEWWLQPNLCLALAYPPAWMGRSFNLSELLLPHLYIWDNLVNFPGTLEGINEITFERSPAHSAWHIDDFNMCQFPSVWPPEHGTLQVWWRAGPTRSPLKPQHFFHSYRVT